MIEIIGGKIFSEIKSDPRVTPDLDECLYCEVRTVNSDDSRIANDLLSYKIPLDNTSHFMKQCPACKRIYILKDPTT